MLILYADILFLINFSMDFLGQFLCSMIMKHKILRIRLIVSSLIGATYGVFSMIVKINSLVNVLLCIFVAIVMILISFNEKHIINLCSLTLMYIFISATLGGIMSIIYVCLNKILRITISNDGYITYSGARIFIIIGLTCIAAIIFGRLFVNKKDVELVEITVKVNNKEHVLSGLCDSGNLLIEPFSGKKVILVSEESEIGKEILLFNEYKVKYIPFRDVSGEGILRGVLPKEIKVNGKHIDVIIATTKAKNFNGCDALVPKTIL